MADGMTRQKQPHESSGDNRLSEFLDEYTIPLNHCSLPNIFGRYAYVFWSQNEGTQQHNASSGDDDDPGLVPHSSDDHPDEIHRNLRKLFRYFSWWFSFDGLIQFWSIVKTGNRCLLTTHNQPFALDLQSGFQKYRLGSHEYRYNIDPDYNLEVEEEDPLIINNGAPAYAFRNHLAEVILDLRVHEEQGNALVGCALECGLMSCFLIPLCDAANDQNRCVGVLEYCTKDFDRLIETGHDLVLALKVEQKQTKVGLRVFDVQKDLLYKAIGGLESKEAEIRAVLDIVGRSHHITLAQVSIAYEDEKLMKRMATLRLSRHNYCMIMKDYCHVVDMLPMQIMEGLASKALEIYKPHSSRSIYEMSNIEQPDSTTRQDYSCLVICLKSISMGDHVDYVFEFLWPREQCYQTTIKRLILTLKECLPNFKFACGAEFGDELSVIDVEKLSKNGIQTTLEIFKGKKLSPTPTLFEEGSKRKVEKGKTHGIPLTLDQIEQQNGRTMEEAATNLDGEKLSSIPKVIEVGRKRNDGKGKTHEISLTLREIQQQYGRTMEEAATNLGVSKSTLKRKWRGLNNGSWPGPKVGKRKVNDTYKDQSDMNEGDNRVTPLAANVDVLTIKAEYQNDLIKLHDLPLSSITVEAVEKEIGEKFKLNVGSFKLKYFDKDGDMILLVSDQDMRDCVKTWTSGKCTTNKLYVQLK